MTLERFALFAQELSREGHYLESAVVCFLGQLHQNGDRNGIRELAESAHQVCSRPCGYDNSRDEAERSAIEELVNQL